MLFYYFDHYSTYEPLYFENHVYFNEYLPAGTYNLSLHDGIGADRTLNNAFACASYSLTYSLVVSDLPPENACVGDPLPTNLTDPNGKRWQRERRKEDREKREKREKKQARRTPTIIDGASNSHSQIISYYFMYYLLLSQML
jgi:hypothetical protein